MQVGANNLVACGEGTSLVNPVVGMLLHAAEARLLCGTASLDSFELVLRVEVFVLGVSETLFNELLH